MSIERDIPYKKLGLSAGFASALLLASCSGSSLQPTPSSEFSPNPNKTPNPTIQVSATETPIVEKTPLEQSKRVALDIWLNAFNYSGVNDQKQQFSLTASVKTSAKNFDQWKNTQVNNILSGQSSSEVLQIRWEDLLIAYDGNNQKLGSADKYVGDLEINNSTIFAQEYPFPLTAADKANGIRWHGTVGINYVQRYRSLFYNGILFDQPATDLSAQTWINKEPADPMPEFSPWYDARFGVELFLMSDGQWKMAREDGRNANDFYFKGLLTPSYYANPDNVMQVQSSVPCTESGYPCKLIRVISR